MRLNDGRRASTMPPSARPPPSAPSPPSTNRRPPSPAVTVASRAPASPVTSSPTWSCWNSTLWFSPISRPRSYSPPMVSLGRSAAKPALSVSSLRLTSTLSARTPFAARARHRKVTARFITFLTPSRFPWGLVHRMDRAAVDQLRRVVEDLRQRRVRVHGQDDVLGGGGVLERQHGLGDQLGHVRPDHVHAEDAVGLHVRDEFHQARRLLHRL